MNETSKNGETALLRACCNENIEIIEYLLSRGVDFEKRSIIDTNALITVVMRDKLEFAELLIKHGAKIDLST